MPTALPLSTKPGMPLRQSARFGWLMLRERYLSRQIHRATLRQNRISAPAGGGWLLHFTRRWLACHAEIAALIGGPEREDVAVLRAVLSLCGLITSAEATFYKTVS